MAKLGVVNCDDEKSLASRFGIKGFPSIKVFKGEGKKARRPSDYNGERSAGAIIAHAKYVMPSYIVRVKDSGIDAFFRDERRVPHVLLFTDKTTTSPLYKGMSAEFKGLASFGEVRKKDAGDLIEKFGVKTFPALYYLKAGDSDPATATLHTGAMDPTSLRKFLASVTEGVEPASAENAAPKEPVFSQPKAFKAEVAPIASGDQYTETCGSRKDGRMCGLAFLPGGASHELAGKLDAVADKFQFDNLAFAVVDTSGKDGGGAALASMFGIDKPEGFVTVRPRKGKYALHDLDVGLSVDSISKFLDELVGGNARFKKLKGDLPSWESPPEEAATGQDPDDSNTKSDTPDTGGTDEDEGQCGTEPPKDGESGKCGP